MWGDYSVGFQIVVVFLSKKKNFKMNNFLKEVVGTNFFYLMKFHNCEVVSEKRTIMMSAEWRVNSLSLSVFPMHTTEARVSKVVADHDDLLTH